MKFLIMTDENVANAVSEQLVKKGVDSIRLIDVLPESTPDPEVLEYCHVHDYALVTLDRGMEGHITERINANMEHAGVFIGTGPQDGSQVGIIVNFIKEYDDLIKGGAASVEDDVYNQVIHIK
jgi:uncharacterized protein DUF5615